MDSTFLQERKQTRRKLGLPSQTLTDSWKCSENLRMTGLS